MTHRLRRGIIITIISGLLTACGGAAGSAIGSPPPGGSAASPTITGIRSLPDRTTAPVQATPSPALGPAAIPAGSRMVLNPWAIAPAVAPEGILVQSTRQGGMELCAYPEGGGVCSMTTILWRDGRIQMLRGSRVMENSRMTSAERETLIAAIDQLDEPAIQAALAPRPCEYDLMIAVTLFTTAGRVDLAGCDADLDRTRSPFSTIDQLLDKYIGR